MTTVETDWEATFGELYSQLGPDTKRALLDLLPDSWSSEGKRVLDFGSGPGRTLRHFLPEAQKGEFWGADIDSTSVSQLKDTLCPPMHVLQCGVAPPLALESGSFDLVWAISVFTHLTDHSIPWLLELHRLLKPDGLLIATYMGRWHSEILADEPWDEDRIGMNVLRHDRDWGHGGPLVLMSDWWVRAHWGRAFDILDIAPRIHNQSWATMRKRDLDLTIDDLERPADDPREYRAVRHNLRQAQREIEPMREQIELVRQQGTASLSDLACEYERSSSWRLTRPLRAGASMARSIRDRTAWPGSSG